MANNIDETIKLDSLFERSSLTSVTEFEKVLAKTLDKINAMLASGSGTEYTRSRLNALKANIIDLINADYSTLAKLIAEDKAEWAQLAFDTQYSAFAAGVEGAVALSFTKIPEAAVKRILDPNNLVMGQTYTELIGKLKVANETVIPIIAEGVTSGRPTPDIVKDITEIYGGIQRHKVDALARTVITDAMQRSNEEAITQIEKQTSVVNVAIYQATLDLRTTPICSQLDGTTWIRKKDESFAEFKSRVLAPSSKSYGRSPNPPLHFNCRSKLIWSTREFLDEYKKGERPGVLTTAKTVNHTGDKNITVQDYYEKYGKLPPTSTKFKIDKVEQVPTKVTFNQWFNRQDVKYQRQYLGNTRYELYKQGNLSVEQLMDVKKNKFYTIDKIKEMYNI